MNADSEKLKKLGVTVDAGIDDVTAFIDEKRLTSWNSNNHNDVKSYFRFLSDKQDKLLDLRNDVTKLLAFVNEQEVAVNYLIPGVFDKIVSQIREGH